MSTDFSVLGKFRNKEQVRFLVEAIRAKGKSCYDFTEKPSDPGNPSASGEEQMKVFESTPDFQNNAYFQEIFGRDLKGLREATTVILLLPAGTSAHIEAGIAYGLGKRLILIGKPEKPESLYLIFTERYESVDDFVATL